MTRYLSLIAAAVVGATFSSHAADQLPLGQIKLPPGFSIELYASNVPFARHMALSPNGTVYVGSMRLGSRTNKYSVHAVVDRNKDNKADEVIKIADGLDSPDGVAFHDGSLYVAEMTRIIRFDNIDANLKTPPAPKVVIDKLPADAQQHGWKVLSFGPDGKLYFTFGAPCNVCDTRKQDPRLASIVRMNPDGGGLEVYARGIRNTVGFEFHPVTKELWFTNNGRDLMGDDVPPDTLNRASKPGMDFGFPYCHAGDIPDPEFGKARKCSEFTPPAQKLGAHVASLGLAFYTGSMFPAEYKNQIFIAEHGSWNRSQKSGYRLTLVRVDANTKATKYEPFAEGWLQGQQNWGRPVDVLVMPDGALLVSDEQTNAIYRISYRR
jgi:glucose/arabinose dehydrogenase